MKVTLLAYTPEPEKMVAGAARLCYSKDGVEEILENFTPEKIDKFLGKLTEVGHFSPIEHVTFVFGIEGVSRALSHQLVRHRIASYSQKSQRYVNESNFEFIVPPKIQANPVAKQIYEKLMNEIREAYRDLSLLVPNEDARYVLPNACETKLVATFNARSLHNFIRLRTCNRAQWEIRNLARLMLKEVRRVAPKLFEHAGPSCETEGVCYEGDFSCRRKHIYFYSDKEEYYWLSNFYFSKIEIDDKVWPTVEHYFQAMKTENPEEQERIRNLPYPTLAKQAGRSVMLRPDWEEIKEQVMKKALYAKFSQSKKLRDKLIATGDAILHEDSPYDKYWGVRGQDRLGKLLMEVREELKNN